MQDIVDEAFERGRRLERQRCIELVCPHCRAHNTPKKGWHTLEVVQGHVAHEIYCPAEIIRTEPT